MGKVAEQFADIALATNSNVPFVQMWIGPRSATEIEKAIAGYPTLVPCCVGPNLNDGRGVQGFKERKGFFTLEEMHRWVKDQKPDQQKWPCPHCVDDEGKSTFIGKTANELASHMKEVHKPENVVSTFDVEGAKEAAEAEKRNKKEQHRPENVKFEPTEDAQCVAIKPDGERCGKKARPGSDYCGIASHQKEVSA